MRGLVCASCGRVIKTEAEPIFYRPSGTAIGLHSRCEDAYNNGDPCANHMVRGGSHAIVACCLSKGHPGKCKEAIA